MGVTPRWVRKLVERAGVRPPKKPEPSKLVLYQILLREVALADERAYVALQLQQYQW